MERQALLERSRVSPRAKDKEMCSDTDRVIVRSFIDLFLKSRCKPTLCGDNSRVELEVRGEFIRLSSSIVE